MKMWNNENKSLFLISTKQCVQTFIGRGFGTRSETDCTEESRQSRICMVQ